MAGLVRPGWGICRMHHGRNAVGGKLPGGRRPWSSRTWVRSEEGRPGRRMDHGDGHRHRHRRVRRGRTQRQTCVPPPSMPRLRGRCAGTQSWKRTSACSLMAGRTAHGRSGPYRRNRANTQCTVEVDRTSARAHSEWRGKPHTVDADRTRAQAPSDSGR